MRKIILALLVMILINNLYSKNKKFFVIGVQNFKEYLPNSQYQNGEYKGFNREILDLFAKKSGYTFIFKAYPIKRLYYNFFNAKVDFKYPSNPYWSKNLKQDKKIIYSDEVVKFIDGVLVKPSNKGRGIAELKRLGVVLGFTPFAYLEKIKLGTIKKVEQSNYKGSLMGVMQNRLDGIYSNIAVSRYYLRNIIKDEKVLVFDSTLPYSESYRCLSSIKYPDIIIEFNKFLKNEKVAIDKLKEKYKIWPIQK